MLNPTTQLIEPEIRELLLQRRYTDVREALHGLQPADVAELLDALEPADAAVAFRFLRRPEAGLAFAELDHDKQEALIAELGNDEAVRVVEAMHPDDRAAALDELPAEVSTRIIASLKPETRRVTQAILGYPEDSVGRLMTPDYVKARPTWTVARTLEQIRRYGRDAETVYFVYVVDHERELLGDVHIRKLLLAQPETMIEDLLGKQLIALNATDDQEEAVHLFARYDRTALPVVDGLGILVGIVTSDDVAEVAEEEATEDIHKLGGLEALDDPYLNTGTMQMLRKRGSVLCILMLFQAMTIGVLGFFDQQLSSATVLVLFIPLIIASGGNIGTQTASLLVRSIAINELTPADWARVLRKEVVTGLGLGAGLGVLATLSVLLWNLTPTMDTTHPGRVGLTVGISVLGIVLWGVTLGSMFPLLLQRLRLDPATISSPLVATLMDLSGLLIYMGCALVLLRGTLL